MSKVPLTTGPASAVPLSTGGGRPFGVGVIGCGNISNQYLKNLTSFPDVTVVICADIDQARAKAQAAAYGVAEWGSPEDALGHPDVRLIVNLTVPAAHAEVTAAAIAAGKHVWSEKPLTLDLAAGRALLDQAAAAGVRVGCAPDTVLGAGLQSAGRLIDSGGIGTPLSALTLLQGPGPQTWHPDPEFLFAPGAGPLFDLGPYYLSVLATLFGPARRVAAIGRKPRESRVIGSGPRAGTEFSVAVPTYVAALAEYVGGQAASLLFSWDSPLSRAGFVEITGTEATLAVPDPNRFDGDLRVRRAGETDWTVIPATGAAAGRGSGVVDMVRAIRDGAPHRASGEMALHVLEMMTAIERSAVSAAFETVDSRFEPPAPLDIRWDPYVAAP
jgi:predicted dehydrogenase